MAWLLFAARASVVIPPSTRGVSVGDVEGDCSAGGGAAKTLSRCALCRRAVAERALSTAFLGALERGAARGWTPEGEHCGLSRQTPTPVPT
ncbi:hypothetical protein DFP72DRAFT_887538 [Ephemerocybe angulata]|uniref:Secreted protein n=1 Tax=Ephemerocybe angulata TaxID=980116 RepID=A0A8H6I618_9AGAR|nr:hypothetical protein DFP72DRAFT_887538 [Tulosesus angulatus]